MTTLPIVHVNQTMFSKRTYSEEAIDFMDSYFAPMSGRRAVVIPNEVSEAGAQKVIELSSDEVDRLGLSEDLLKKIVRVVSYFTVVLPALVWVAQKIYHWNNSFETVSIDNTLKISNEKLRNLADIHNQRTGEITKYGNHIFCTTDAPGFIFKGHVEADRIKNARFAQLACRIYDLNLLKVPQMTKVSHFVIEEMLPCDPSDLVQQEKFKQSGKALDQAIQQLVFFILVTGYHDIKYVNNPVLDGEEFVDEDGNRHIALVDTEFMNRPKQGLHGLSKLISIRQGVMVHEALSQWEPSLSPLFRRILKAKNS